MKRPSIALTCIAKNEEENLKRFYESFEDCVDEWHLTDTGSTDNTVDLARSLGAKVHHFDWIDDFSAARNASFEPIKTDFALWLDLDDVLENPSAFKQFRDDVMGLADYWMAAYHYSSDSQGNAICSFARERVIRMGRGLKWKYFLHEGISPLTATAPIRMQYISSWAVRHMRTDADMKKDRSRNIKIFEKQKLNNKLDSRMMYYYGKELFESDQPVEATHWLMKATAEPDLEMHDRVLAYQYACYAYMKCNQFPKAMETAYLGLMIAPNRAEYHIVIADCHLKMGKLHDAIPHLSAAKACKFQGGGNVTGPIFQTEDAYGVYPRNMLARIYANVGEIDEAEKEIELSLEKKVHPDTTVLHNEIKKVKALINGYKTAKQTDDIVITTAPINAYEWDGDLAKTQMMGGSETAAIEMAYWLKKVSGKNVKVFNMRETDKICDGVEYISNKKIQDYMSVNKPYMHIAWRHNIKLTDAPTFLWCHDLITMGAEQSANYTKLMCLTPFHKRYVMGMQGIPEGKIIVTRNGIKPERFKDGPWKKDPYLFVFPNSPDRGLDRCMKVLDKVREVHPGVRLRVHYGIEHLPKYGHQELHDRLLKMFKERPWVEYVGKTQQEKLMDSFKEAAYWVSPSDWIETSMISAMELVACGVYPIFRGIGGVVDTLSQAVQQGMATQIDGEAQTEEELDKFVDATLLAMAEKKYEHVKIDVDALSWEKVAREWLEELPKLGN